MYKLVAVLLFVLAMSRAEGQGIDVYYNSSVLHTDTYINLNRQQHAKYLQEYDDQINVFKQTYAASLKTIEVQGDMLINNLNEMNERLNSLEALSQFSQACVKKYRPSLPTEATTRTSINTCINTANNQLSSMLSAPLATRSYLANYYEKTFERSISNCKSKFSSEYYYLNYTLCIVDAVDEAQVYIITSQKSFASQMETAHCTANSNIKKALDCGYNNKNHTMSLMAEVNTLLKKCLLGQDDCNKCSLGYKCSDISYITAISADYRIRDIQNPFYGRYDAKDCLILKIK